MHGRSRTVRGTVALLAALVLPSDAFAALAGETPSVTFTVTADVARWVGRDSDHRTHYAGLADLRVDLPTRVAGLWGEGHFFAVAENGHGSGLDLAPAGVQLVTSDIVAPAHTELSQWGLRQRLGGGTVTVQLGRQDVNETFCVNPPGGDFMEPAFTLVPTVPMPTFPAPALGVAVVVHPAGSIRLRAGLFDGRPQISDFGVDTFFDRTGGTFSVVEPEWTSGRGVLAGSYRIGLWYHSGSFPRVGSAAGPSFGESYGAYLVAQRTVASDSRGARAAVFLQGGASPSDRTRVARYVGAGGTVRLAPARPHDELGLGVNRLWLVGGDGRMRPSTTAELFYVVAVNDWLGLQPDVQYYSQAGPHGNALALSLRWIVHR